MSSHVQRRCGCELSIYALVEMSLLDNVQRREAMFIMNLMTQMAICTLWDW